MKTYTNIKILRSGILRADGNTFVKSHSEYPIIIQAYIEKNRTRINELAAEAHETNSPKRRAEIRAQIQNLNNTIKRLGGDAEQVIKPEPLKRANIKEYIKPKFRTDFRTAAIVKTRTTRGKIRIYDPNLRMYIEFRSDDQQERFFQRLKEQEINLFNNTKTLITTQVP